ncbi:MAG: hypothetical protein IJ113_00595 [Eggerthellaceae bacterium]|nr:hypothetical protein [Eggerthellaceae bacterium]
MDEQRLEHILEKHMKQDFSNGTEAFRDELLARCLDVLSLGDGATQDENGIDIDEADLELLAAAGLILPPDLETPC